MECIRILLADDHPIFRDGLAGLIALESDMELVGEVATGNDAVKKALELQPDVILLDLNMPELNGVDAARSILHSSPHIAILVITMFDDHDSVFAAMRAGALGYILKDADREEILRAIRAVSKRQAIFSPAVAKLLIRFFAQPGPIEVPPQLFPELTKREREVLLLIAQGMDNPKIAELLGVSGKTVRNYVSNIFNKLQVADRTQAILLARESGLSETGK